MTSGLDRDTTIEPTFIAGPSLSVTMQPTMITLYYRLLASKSEKDWGPQKWVVTVHITIVWWLEPAMILCYHYQLLA